MKYLVTTTDKEIPPFLTNWFEAENHFNEEIGMVVYDLLNHKYTKDGEVWHDIEIDHL